MTFGDSVCLDFSQAKPPAPQAIYNGGRSQASPDLIAVTIPQLLHAVAESGPDRIALLAANRPPLSYLALMRRVEETAGWLASAGIGRSSQRQPTASYRQRLRSASGNRRFN